MTGISDLARRCSVVILLARISNGPFASDVKRLFLVVDRDRRAEFERSFAGSPSVVAERVWREVFGDEYPEGVDRYSYVSVSELDRFVREVRLKSGDTLVDAGCGRGGPGLFVAAATGARLVGVDIAEAGLAAARTRAQGMGIRAEFVRGTFESTGLGDAGADAVMSVDALLFTPDKAAALRERCLL
jgi:2-polyprenyl-3-methyl-5-hydroxy-6-metoxy-1,4-benzoquinol methylase